MHKETNVGLRILAFSDWRVQDIGDIFKRVQTILEPIDVILYAGDDIGRFGGRGKNYFTDLAEYTTCRKVLAVAGNDERQEAKSVLRGKNVVDLHEEPFAIGKFGFMGMESATVGPGSLIMTETEARVHLKKQYAKVRGKNVVIVSHAPPSGILDSAARFASKAELRHSIGSKSLREFIRRNDIRLVVCGHAHLVGRSSDEFCGTMVANVSSHDYPGSAGNFALVEFYRNAVPHIEWSSTRDLVDPNSIMRLREIGEKRSKVLKKAGIKTIQDLASIKNLQKISCMTGWTEKFLAKIQLKARSFADGRIIQTSSLVLPPGDMIFFDIETDVYCRRVWLIGALQNGRFRQFYAKDWDEEKHMLEKFLRFLKQSPNPVLVSYSSKSFDRRVVKDALERTELDSVFFSSIPHKDLCNVIERSLLIPIESYGLKTLAKYMGYAFSHPDLGGLAVAQEYQKHLDEGRRLDGRVLEYNRDDVESLPWIIDKIRQDGYDVRIE